jgi:hypothetical protein
MDMSVLIKKYTTQSQRKAACLTNVKDPKGDTRFQVRVGMVFAVKTTARAQYVVTAFTTCKKIF